MREERACARCTGKEHKVMNAPLAGWPQANAGAEHWYCPRCDWGRLARDEDEIVY